MRRLAAIALGSNLASRWGDREATLHEAIHRMAQLGDVTAVSAFYDTEPVGDIAQPNFLNGAVLLSTDLDRVSLMRSLLAIELSMGRDRARVPAKGPRVIDLDLILLGDEVVESEELTLPHPAMTQRAFVLQPLTEIAPAMVDPSSGFTIRELFSRLG